MERVNHDYVKCTYVLVAILVTARTIVAASIRRWIRLHTTNMHSICVCLFLLKEVPVMLTLSSCALEFAVIEIKVYEHV